MPVYLVKMEHPDGESWNQHLLEHVLYLKNLVPTGKLLASGPVKGGPLRAGFLIMQTENRAELEALISNDPFSRENLVCDLRIEEWDPLFGALAAHSSNTLPPELASLT